MFGKDKHSNKIEKTAPLEPAPVLVKQPESVESTQGNTVIASDVRFDGNISAAGMIYIHGKVYGNIESLNGLIKIMRNGYVEGNILAKEVVIDGTVIGQCHADSIDIHENGKITGAMAYHTLAIKRGGEFTGQAELRPKTISNVVDIVTESQEETEEVEALQEANS